MSSKIRLAESTYAKLRGYGRDFESDEEIVKRVMQLTDEYLLALYRSDDGTQPKIH